MSVRLSAIPDGIAGRGPLLLAVPRGPAEAEVTMLFWLIVCLLGVLTVLGILWTLIVLSVSIDEGRSLPF
jgi:hypothetical protein